VLHCLYCGAPLKEKHNGCHCGNQLHEGSSLKPPFLTEEESSSDSRELLKRFIGLPKADFYMAKWEKDSHMSWNWPAFLFTWFWLGYRKLYSHLFILLGLFVIIDIFSYFLGGNQDNAVGVTFAIIYGLFGNYFYKKHAEKKVRNILQRNLSKAEMHEQINRQGGTSKLGILASFAVLFLYVLVTMAMYYLLASF
jgi:hypothetical protein